MAKNNDRTTKETNTESIAEEQTLPKKCGLVMPISATEEYTEEHWIDVKSIIVEALDDTGFEIDLVSNARDSGIIHKRIVENLYENPIIICDVSSRNPNVMFELGLRLAFDKPTVIVKDDETPYSFDTSIIEHIPYPKSLRHNKIQKFQKDLRDKVLATYESAKDNPNYSTFLKHFVNLKAGEFLSKEIPDVESLIELFKKEISGSITNLSSSVEQLRNDIKPKGKYINSGTDVAVDVQFKKLEDEFINKQRIEKILRQGPTAYAIEIAEAVNNE